MVDSMRKVFEGGASGEGISLNRLKGLSELLDTTMLPGERIQLGENTFIVGNKHGDPIIMGRSEETFTWWRVKGYR